MMPLTELLDVACTRMLGGLTKLSREEMRLAGYPETRVSHRRVRSPIALNVPVEDAGRSGISLPIGDIPRSPAPFRPRSSHVMVGVREVSRCAGWELGPARNHNGSSLGGRIWPFDGACVGRERPCGVLDL